MKNEVKKSNFGKFMLLWSGELISSIGGGLTSFGLGVYIFQKTGIIATKKDICTENDKYKFYQLKKFCKEYDAIPYFLSVKKDKKEIYNFINLFCPTIIPSLVNKKKEIKFDYPYTKSAQNIIPKENNLDKEILKKLKEDDSSYESVKDEQNNKKINREELIKEYIKKKEIEKNTKKRKKIIKIKILWMSLVKSI